MCGQWSETGYVKSNKKMLKQEMELVDWKMLADELYEHKVLSVLLRGGEVFLVPDIMQLIEYIHNKGIFISIDTNGTLVSKFAKDLVRMGNMHLTFSVDGPEEIHDQVRCVKGSYQKIKESILIIHELEKINKNKLSKSITFTISPYSYKGLGRMPDIARDLGIDSIVIAPYYYFPEHVGKEYEKVLDEEFSSKAYSWKGFHHDNPGIDLSIFREEYRKFIDNLKGIKEYPYMGPAGKAFHENELLEWFSNPTSIVGRPDCMNVEKYADIQPNGDVNFCCDFPDYVIGNVKKLTIYETWNSERADHFRKYRREKPLPICYRCGAKYMAEIPDKN
jgi:radical SAM protein with 4Fe4S-binding SPASM domain